MDMQNVFFNKLLSFDGCTFKSHKKINLLKLKVVPKKLKNSTNKFWCFLNIEPKEQKSQIAQIVFKNKIHSMKTFFVL